MVFKKCPGQDLSRKRIENTVADIPCSKCGALVEFFFDDLSRVCPACGTLIRKSEQRILKDFKCAVWCEAAEECVGQQILPLRSKKKKD